MEVDSFKFSSGRGGDLLWQVTHVQAKVGDVGRAAIGLDDVNCVMSPLSGMMRAERWPREGQLVGRAVAPCGISTDLKPGAGTGEVAGAECAAWPEGEPSP